MSRKIPRPVNEWYSAHARQETVARFQALEGRTITSAAAVGDNASVAGRWDISSYKSSNVFLQALTWPEIFATIQVDPAFRDGDEIYFVGGQYDMTAGFVITRPMRVTGSMPVIRITANTKFVDVQTSNVHILGLTFQGLSATTYSSSSFGVYSKGLNADTPNTNIMIELCKFYDISGIAVQLEFCERIVIRDCHYQRYARAANMLLSSSYGVVEGCLIEDALNGAGNPSNNTYPLAISRNTTLGITAQPRSTNWTVRDNIVINNPWWEGIDTHGGDTITIENNRLYNVDQPIAVVSSADVGSGASVFAPQNVVVSHNYMNSMRTDGGAKAGIVVDGAGTTAGGMIGHPVELASGCVVDGNTVIGHGRQNTSTNAGIVFTWTQGLIVTRNHIYECSVHGIAIQNDNYGFIIKENVIRDAWSNSLTNPSCITLATFYCTGLIDGNVRVVGNKVATYVGVRGITVTSSRVPATHNNDVVLGMNHWGPETVDEINSIVSLWSGGSLRFGFGNQRQNMTDLTAKVATTGATNDQLAAKVNAMHDVLVNLGVSFDTT